MQKLHNEQLVSSRNYSLIPIALAGTKGSWGGGATRLFHSNWSFAALRLCFIKDDVVSHQEINKYSSRSTQRLFCTLVEESVFNWLVR